MTAEWLKSIRPDQRDLITWNAIQDTQAKLYRAMEPGDEFTGMLATVINGCLTYRLFVERDGQVRRVIVGGDAGEAGAA